MGILFSMHLTYVAMPVVIWTACVYTKSCLSTLLQSVIIAEIYHIIHKNAFTELRDITHIKHVRNSTVSTGR